MKFYIFIPLLVLSACVSRISIEDGVNKPVPTEDPTPIEKAVTEVAPSEKA
jgi:hypothetical protein